MSGPLLDFVIKDHAHFEMQRRQITENQVRLVLKSPEQVIKGTMGDIFINRDYRLRIDKKNIFFE